jgi:hypothetical protein
VAVTDGRGEGADEMVSMDAGEERGKTGMSRGEGTTICAVEDATVVDCGANSV